MGCTPSKAKKTVDKKKKSRVLASSAPVPRPSVEALKTPVPPTPELVRPVGSHEDLVSAPSAQPPQFEETGKEGQDPQSQRVEVKEHKIVRRQENRDSATFHWPTAYELRREPKEKRQIVEEATAERQAERAAIEKAAYLEECKREKERRRSKMTTEDEDRDDTLFEQPTRMPNYDFVSEKGIIF